MKKLICPECGQTHFKRAEMIYSSGTRYGESSGPNYTVRYHNQTRLAELCSPPLFFARRPSSPLKVMLFVAYLLVLTVYLVPIDSLGTHVIDFARNWVNNSLHLYFLKYWLLYTIFAGLFAYGFWLAKQSYDKNMLIYEQQWQNYSNQYDDWLNTWVCMNCGYFLVK
jgi:predicted RNA-binding Zn-ribbon protein involved in translation (DUF1610 family)